MEVTLINVNHNYQAIYALFSVASIFALNFIIFLLMSFINNNNKIILENSVLRQVQFYEKQNAQNIQNIYDKTRDMRHNMKYHIQNLFAEINSIISIENAENQAHIDNMHIYLNKIITELVNISPIINTENSALNNILNYKISIAHDVGIHIEPQIIYTITGIDVVDITVLIGNLLDNAIEECEKIESKEKKIIIKIVKSKFYVNISVKNPTHIPILKNNPNLKSTKQEKEFHGMGIRSIENIVKKYNGLMNYEGGDDYIIAEILLVENNNIG